MKARIIYYLMTDSKLDGNYLRLERGLKQFNYQLVPVSYSDLLKISAQDYSFHVVCIVASKSDKIYYERKLSKIVRMLLRNKDVCFQVVSSFESISEYGSSTSKQNYQFSLLPLKLNRFMYDVIEFESRSRDEERKWPGGRSPRMTL